MSSQPVAPKDPSTDPFVERRSASRGSESGQPLKKIKGALSRPVTLEWRNGHPHVVLVERRKTPHLDRAQAHLCDELRARLLANEAGETSKLLRYLVVVHDALRNRGWDGVAKLPATVLSKAAMQAVMLASEDPTPLMSELASRLRSLHAAAAAHEDANRRPEGDDDEHTLQPYEVEVSETSFNEFERLERNWQRTMPTDLTPLPAEG